MRRLILITLLMTIVLPSVYGQVKVKLTCPDSWGPGKYSKVTIDIDFGRSGGFARFTQDYPEGFEIEPDIITSGDFNWSGNQVNVVWMDFPENRTVSFSYYVKPGSSMNGNFDLESRVIIISSGDTRNIFRSEPRKITIGGTGGLTTVEKFSEGAAPGAGYEFRIQVTISSRNNPEEVRRRLKIGRDEKITVVRSGEIFKYQVGSFSNYETAKKALDRLVTNGIRDAFIVAYAGDEQIPVSKALDGGR